MASPYSTGRRGVQYGGRVSGVGGAKSIKGAEDLLRLSKALKAAGQSELRKELHKTMRDAAKPIIPEIREAARKQLPSTGGLNERIARKPYRAQVRTGVKTAGVRITGTKVDSRINQGRVAHPVFGRPGSTVVQQVPSADGYFDDTIRERGPEIRDELRAAFQDFLNRLARKF